MKAKILNKEDENYGKIFMVSEIHEKFVSLIVNRKKLDYGFSEIKIIVETDRDKMILGSYLLRYKSPGESNGFLRHSEIIKFCKNINFPASLRTMSAAISHYMWN